jgi:hypothetical protein
MNTMDTPTSNLPIHPCKAGIEEKRWKEWTYAAGAEYMDRMVERYGHYRKREEGVYFDDFLREKSRYRLFNGV